MQFNTYLSPFSWRYGSKEMRYIFSEEYKYKLWRKIWLSLAETQHTVGLVSKKELDDLKKNSEHIDITRILEIEKETQHDVVAAIKEFAEKAKIGGGKIHTGATSMDIVDNADTVRMSNALRLIEEKLKTLLQLFAEKIEKYASLPCIGFTHLQPAEPTTVGYRFAFYAQDLLIDYTLLQFVKKIIKGKGLKGAVGTAASYASLLNDLKLSPTELESAVMKKIGIEPALISTQVSSRKYDYLVMTVVNSIASSCAKFAGDLRILQSPPIGEWSEPFGKKQVGSSAMPFKMNPKNSEKICSLARYINSLPQVALENATLSYLERTLDDSANKRIIIAEGFLALDEIMQTTIKIVYGMIVNKIKVHYNLQHYAPFAATERILMEAVKRKADRQKFHEILRNISMIAWSEIQTGRENPMEKLLMENKDITKYLSLKMIEKLLNVSHHVGNAPERALSLVKQIKKIYEK